MKPQHFLKPSIVMSAFAAISASVLWLVYQYANPILAQHQEAQLLAQLNAIIPSTSYNNQLTNDKITFTQPSIQAKGSVIAYRARLNDTPVASLLVVTTPNGYSGDIKLLIGIWADGRIAGVTVLSHKETPGLGDYIESQRSPWIRQFNDKSLSNPTIERWKVKKDGGIFTYNTGATITPRAIVGMVAKTLTWVQDNQHILYAPISSQEISHE